jgi:hypothetical protein
MATYTITNIYSKPDGDADREYIELSIEFSEDNKHNLTICHDSFSDDDERKDFVDDYVLGYETDLNKPVTEVVAVESDLINEPQEV